MIAMSIPCINIMVTVPKEVVDDVLSFIDDL